MIHAHVCAGREGAHSWGGVAREDRGAMNDRAEAGAGWPEYLANEPVIERGLGYLVLKDESQLIGYERALERSHYTGVVETRQPTVIYHAYVDGAYRAGHKGLAAAATHIDGRGHMVAVVVALAALLVGGANILARLSDAIALRLVVHQLRRQRTRAMALQRTRNVPEVRP